MNHLRLTLQSIQHVAHLSLELDLSENGLMCLVSRNGTGKTTLVRAFRNLASADTFIRTATPYAFSQNSRIIYDIDEIQVVFSYDEKIRSLNCRDKIPTRIRSLISAELPMPHGARFNYFKSASEADLDIRKSIALGKHQRPDELIEFLNSIYDSSRYSEMVEVKVREKLYYAIVKSNGTYIREDYLSSGEYFLINLYRTIKGPAKLLVIDEIDLSLDAAAQANLSSWLRWFSNQYECKILFTTHSLALMRQLETREIFYMEEIRGRVSISPVSYSFAMARLFGFVGCDRYILTEDKMLVAFIQHLIKKYSPQSILLYKVIYIGGASQIAGLIEGNEAEEFLAPPENVIAILDADQRNERYAGHRSIHMIPLDSVEKSLLEASREDPEFPFQISKQNFTGGKDLNNYLIQQKIATQEQIFDYLITRHEEEFLSIANILRDFLPSAHGRTPLGA